MTFAGAQGETEKQMADTMHFTLPQARLHPAFNALDRELASRGSGSSGKDEAGFRLNVVNAIWGQQDYTFLLSYLDTLAEHYGAGLRILDFVREPELSRVTINDWISEETENRIRDLIPEGGINEATRLVLTNAVYFNAAWLSPFVEDTTSPGSFTLLNGNVVTVPMMQQQRSFPYARGEDYQVVELPYDGQELSMVILVPNAGTFNDFEGRLHYSEVRDIIASLEHQEVRLAMPRFTYEDETGLKDVLSSLGMDIAFTSGADFSGIDGTRDLFIQNVLHKAFVSVDEAGTEAAAATAVMVGLTALPPEPVAVTIDRPFIFLIRDVQTGSILFVGRVVDPTQA
jgi:serpin B